VKACACDSVKLIHAIIGDPGQFRLDCNQDRSGPRVNHRRSPAKRRTSVPAVALTQPVIGSATRKVVDNPSTGMVEGDVAWPTGC